MKQMIFGSSLFLGGIISMTLIITRSTELYWGLYFWLMLGFAISGFLIMIFQAFGNEGWKHFFSSNYDINGNRK